MGGFGSGNWNRHRSYNTVDLMPEFYAIDFKNLRGEVAAKARDEFSNKSIRLRYFRNGSTVVLIFHEQERIDGDEPLAPIIKIVSTPCHFGGEREWLLCPEPTCGRRVGSLFIGEHHRIACRKCLGLLYESQYGGRIENRLSRLRAIHRKFGRGGIGARSMAMQTAPLFHSLIDELRKIDRIDL